MGVLPACMTDSIEYLVPEAGEGIESPGTVVTFVSNSEFWLAQLLSHFSSHG